MACHFGSSSLSMAYQAFHMNSPSSTAMALMASATGYQRGSSVMSRRVMAESLPSVIVVMSTVS